MGNLKIDKLRAILLIEADYNWMYKLLINKRHIPCAKELGLLPDEAFGSRKDSRVINVSV